MAKSKERTYEQAEAAKVKAVNFLRNVVGDKEKASEIEALTVEEYSDRKGFILNPASGSENSPLRSEHMQVFESNPVDEDVEVIAEDFETIQAGAGELDPDDHDYDAERDALNDVSREDLEAEVMAWREGGDRIWHATAKDLADVVVDELNTIDPDRYPVDDD